MTRPRLKQLLLLAPAASLLAACGTQQINLDRADRGNARISEGARIFADRCGGCHTLDEVGTHGSAIDVRNRERPDGPNFNTRREDKDAILYAIRNGGFSGAIMPANIVVGEDAEAVADFLAQYSGKESGTNDPTASGQGQDQ